jgi:hypothetical protein
MYESPIVLMKVRIWIAKMSFSLSETIIRDGAAGCGSGSA